MSKNNDRLLTISQVALKFGLINKKNGNLLTHTLRFWETRFKQLKPTILPGGRRYYSAQDIEIIKMIFFLLKEQCLTINGAIKVMNRNSKQLDVSKTSSIKAEYYKNKIKKNLKKFYIELKN